MIYDAVRANDLIAVRRRVYRVAGAPFDHETAILAAVLAAGDATYACGLSAAELFHFRRFPVPDAIHLLSEGANRPRLPGVQGHRTLSLPPYDLTHIRSIPTTTPERAFIDECGSVSATMLAEAGDDLLRRSVIRLPRLMKSFELIPRSGRRQRRPMYGFFEERVKGYDPGGSERELDVMKLIRAAGPGLVVPRQQYRVRVEGHLLPRLRVARHDARARVARLGVARQVRERLPSGQRSHATVATDWLDDLARDGADVRQ